MGNGPLPWRTLRSKIIVSDRWLTLRAETCQTSDGTQIDPFYVIESPDVVGVVATTSDNQLVLVRQYRHGYGGPTLEIPAGRVDAGETAVAAGQRELAEETGFTGGIARLIRAFSPNTLRYANRVHAVLIEGVERTLKPVDDPLERIETVMWPLSRASDLLNEPTFANAALAGLLATALLELRR